MAQAEPTPGLRFDELVQIEFNRIRALSEGQLRCLCFHHHSSEHLSHAFTEKSGSSSTTVHIISSPNSSQLLLPLGAVSLAQKAALLMIAERFARGLFDTKNPCVRIVCNDEGQFVRFDTATAAAAKHPLLATEIPCTEESVLKTCCFFSMPSREQKKRGSTTAMLDSIMLKVRNPPVHTVIQLSDTKDPKQRRVLHLHPYEVRAIKDQVMQQGRAHWQPFMLALCMGTHSRLGSNAKPALLRETNADVLRIVMMELFWKPSELWIHDDNDDAPEPRRSARLRAAASSRV